MTLKKLLDVFDASVLQRFEIGHFLFDHALLGETYAAKFKIPGIGGRVVALREG